MENLTRAGLQNNPMRSLLSYSRVIFWKSLLYMTPAHNFFIQVSPWPGNTYTGQTLLGVVNMPLKSIFRNCGHLIINIKTTITSVNDLKYQSIVQAVHPTLISKRPWGNRNSTVTKLLLLKDWSFLQDSRTVSISSQWHQPSDAHLHSFDFVRVKYASVTQYKIENLTKWNTAQSWDYKAWPQEGKVWSLARMITCIPCLQTKMIQVLSHWPDNTKLRAGVSWVAQEKKASIL